MAMPPERRTTRSQKAAKQTTNAKLPAAVRTPKKNTTLIVAGGVGGGAVLLLLIIVAASSGGGRRQPSAPTGSAPIKAPPPVVQRESRNSTSDTGPIMFICGGSAQHEDKEVILAQCPACKAVDRFSWDGGQYVCQACRKAFDNAKVACPQCGKVPRTHRIKHR